MKISEAWLREWVNPALDTKSLAHLMTMAGLEINSIDPVAGNFSGVVVAKVVQTAVHPRADKLTLCDVSIGDSAPLIRVVCGARNVRQDLYVALALPGALLPGDFEIKPSILRGEPSDGMLCSASELGLTDQSEGILELAANAPLGCDLREYLVLDDTVLDIDLTPNRADCLSVQGVAREIAALTKCQINPPQISPIESSIKQQLSVNVLNSKVCPVYYSRIIKNINTHAVTPLWLQEKLRRSGIRIIHPVVDVLNYVMLELGQPMHAFDAAHVKGPLSVRYAEEGEIITLLDERTVTLSQDVLIVADETMPLAIAGVMGGLHGSVQAATLDIVLEAAYFDPIVIAGIARRYGLSTDASQRFERGVDPALAPLAMERATALLQAIVGGEIGNTVLFQPSNEPNFVREDIVFSPEKVQRLTGVKLPFVEIEQILQRLGMVVDTTCDPWRVIVPSYRFDLALDVDLVEEIIRIYGYENIQAEPTVALMQAGKTSFRETLSNKMASFLSDVGYQETINYAFVDPMLQEAMYTNANTINLTNPISSELSQMRVGLWPGLIASMLHNINRQHTALRLFERGVVFTREQTKPRERLCIAGLLTGTTGDLSWNLPTTQYDFYDIKGDVQALLQRISTAKFQFVADEHTTLHPGKTASILNAEQQKIGVVGVLHPRIQDALDLTQEVLLFELDLEVFTANSNVRYATISKYPQVRRDLSLLVPQAVTALQIENLVREVVSPEIFQAMHVFDVYTGENIPQLQKSISVACVFQHSERTLIDAEVNAAIEAILAALSLQLSVHIRME